MTAQFIIAHVDQNYFSLGSKQTAGFYNIEVSDEVYNAINTSAQHSDTFTGYPFVDRNGNGVWDTGDYDKDLQAEEMYYYPQKIECKAKFDVTLSWNLTSTPRTRQKPTEITKQKPDKEQAKLRNRNADRARELGIEYVKKVKE